MPRGRGTPNRGGRGSGTSTPRGGGFRGRGRGGRGGSTAGRKDHSMVEFDYSDLTEAALGECRLGHSFHSLARLTLSVCRPLSRLQSFSASIGLSHSIPNSVWRFDAEPRRARTGRARRKRRIFLEFALSSRRSCRVQPCIQRSVVARKGSGSRSTGRQRTAFAVQRERKRRYRSWQRRLRCWRERLPVFVRARIDEPSARSGHFRQSEERWIRHGRWKRR